MQEWADFAWAGRRVGEVAEWESHVTQEGGERSQTAGIIPQHGQHLKEENIVTLQACNVCNGHKINRKNS